MNRVHPALAAGGRLQWDTAQATLPRSSRGNSSQDGVERISFRVIEHDLFVSR
jgi:hypothetical protein